jgi:hypothetical protein
MKNSSNFLSLLGLFLLVIPLVQAVVFASDYFYLYEQDSPVSDKTVIIMFQRDNAEVMVFQEIYTGEVFELSQVERGKLIFYTTNNTTLLTYPEWLEIYGDASSNHDLYVDTYIA